MAFLQPVAFIDTLPILGLLRAKCEKLVQQFDGRTSRLDLRDKKGAECDLISGKEPWRGAMNVLNATRKTVGKVPAMTDKYGLCFIEMLPPGAATDWARLEGDYHDKHERFILPLATNPGAWLYAGTEALCPGVGHLIWLSARIPHSAVNFGETQRLWLVADFGKEPAA